MAKYDLSTLGSDKELFSNTGSGSQGVVLKIPNQNRVINFYQDREGGFNGEILARCFDVNLSTGAWTTLGSVNTIFEAGLSTSGNISAYMIDATNGVVTFRYNTAMNISLFTVDGSGNVTPNGTSLSTGSGDSPYSMLWDSTHLLVSWYDSSASSKKSQIFSLNTGTGTVTALGSALSFGSSGGNVWGIIKLDANKALVMYGKSDSDLYGIVQNVNTSTWAVTNAGSEATLKASITGNSMNGVLMSSSPMVVALQYCETGASTYMRTYSINTSTWAISAFGSELTQTGVANGINFRQGNLAIIDSETIIAPYSVDGTENEMWVDTIDYDSGTGNLTVLDSLKIQDASANTTQRWSVVEMDTGQYVVAFQGTNSGNGWGRILEIELSIDYSMTASQGSIALTGQTVALKASLKMVAGLGSFVLAGQNAVMSYGKIMVASMGSFSLTGQDVLLKVGRYMSAVQGSFTLTGQDITMTSQRIMRAVVGSFTLTGQVVRFAVNGLYVRWKTRVKNIATYTSQAKSETDWINRDKTL